MEPDRDLALERTKLFVKLCAEKLVIDSTTSLPHLFREMNEEAELMLIKKRLEGG